jgi:mRNA deadenylase 3'-5' endonuclease subunit Ccr4
VAITSNDKSQLPYYFASSSAVVHGEPPFTNAVGEFRGTLDYVFVSNPQDHWTVHDSYLFGPSIASITSLPTAEFPSDHLLVLATLSLN